MTEPEVRLIAGAVAAATSPTGGLTAVQRAVLNAMCEFLLGVAVDLGSVEHVGPAEFAEAMSQHDPRLIRRIVQSMLIGELLLAPLPLEVCRRVETYATALGVDDEAIGTARDIAQGSLDLAMVDFERSGYFNHLSDRPAIDVPIAAGASVWQRDWDDPGLASKWQALQACPSGSLGLGVWRFYTARGFTFPGSPESAPPTLAQHDWVHVLADYGSTVESEIEVFGLIARSNPDFRAFSLLGMVLSLFETGSIAEGAGGFFARNAGHIARNPAQMGVRLGDAMSRGKRVAESLEVQGRLNDADLLAVDWFAYAESGLAQVQSEFCLPEKSPRSIAAGSVNPWEPGGISAYQLRLGNQRAQQSGRPYLTWGAEARN